MPYLFTCPHCQTATQVDDRYSGMSGACVSCGKAIQLPSFAEPGSGPAPPPAARANLPLRGFVAAGVTAILFACLLFAVIRFGGQSITRLAASRDQSMALRNLQQIAAAINAYAADHGVYPPQRTTDSRGRPLHSWRVLILPYLEETDLYSQIDLTVPWDHPKHADLLFQIPRVYQHPTATSANEFQAGFYLVTGPGTLFPEQGPFSPRDLTDDPAQTLLVVDAAPPVASQSWLEPVDLDVVRLRGNIGGDPATEIGGLLEGGAAVATADGRSHFLPRSTDPFTVRALITPRGGERLPADVLD